MTLQFDTSFRSARNLTGWIRSLDFSNDGALLAVGQSAEPGAPAIVLYSTADASPVAQLGQDGSAGLGVVMCGDGERLFYVLREESGATAFMTAELATSRVDRIAEYGPAEDIHGLIRDASGRLIAILSDACEVWDVEQREVVRFREAQSPRQPVHAAFSNDGTKLYASGITEGVVTLIDVNANREIGQWPSPTPYAKQVVVDRSGRYLVVVGTPPFGVFVYDTRSGDRLLPAEFNEKTFTSLYAFAHTHPVILTKSVSPVAIDLESGELIEGPDIATGDLSAAVTAWESPVLALAVRDEVFWIRMFETEG
jgi:WD40 repeat protein